MSAPPMDSAEQDRYQFVECRVCGPLTVTHGGGAAAAAEHSQATGHMSIATWRTAS